MDTRDLSIERVTLCKEESPTGYKIGDEVEFLGNPLTIEIGPHTSIVNVYYSTNPEAAAIDWVSPIQTAGGIHPFLYTQSQAILARTWIPLQDSPGIRFTYDATISVPAGLMAVMSAENPIEKSSSGVYEFKMPQPIPSYLMALAVGNIEFREMGPRTGIYAEPELVVQRLRYPR